MASSSKPLNIVTIGGSLGGVMTSIALRRLGHNVRILERSPTPLLHDQGAGIVMGGDTQEFMTKFDLTKTPSFVKSRQRLYLDSKGEIIHRESTPQNMTSWDLLYSVLRANFDGLSSGHVANPPKIDEIAGESVYQHGSSVTNLESVDTGVKVSYKRTGPGEKEEQTGDYIADFVVIADGASSGMRRLVSPSSSSRSYAGYVAFRGTVLETELSHGAMAVFVEKFSFYHSKNIQILAYTIPGRNGSLGHGQRLVNWVWYWNVEQDSDEFRKIFTDRANRLHRFSLPPGDNMSEEVWAIQKQRADELLSPQFSELVRKTKSPFVQAITDLEPPADEKAWVLEGKAVLVGDAVAGFRPHTAASTSQAAFHANLLSKVFSGDMTRDEYEGQVMMFSKAWQTKGVTLGDRSQFGNHPLQR